MDDNAITAKTSIISERIIENTIDSSDINNNDNNNVPSSLIAIIFFIIVTTIFTVIIYIGIPTISSIK